MEDPPKYPEVAAIFTRLLNELGLSGNQLAKSLGTSQQVISGYASGRTNPGREMIASIIERYPAINAAWLVTGAGEPFPAGRFNEKPAAQLPPPVPSKHEERPSGFPVAPGTATPQEADFVGRYITQLEAENQRQAGMIEWLQQQNEVLLGKSPASALAAIPAEPRQEITGFRVAASLPEGKVVAMWPGYSLVEAA